MSYKTESIQTLKVYEEFQEWMNANVSRVRVEKLELVSARDRDFETSMRFF